MEWSKLSMPQRAEYIRLGVRNGITDINSIRETYNEYAKGGYLDWISKVKEWRPGIDKDIDAAEPTYDYKSFYNENPERAWKMLEGDPEAHFIDKYKKPNHPTFSDESIYSTPETPGGHWSIYGDRNVYTSSEYTKARKKDTLDYLTGNGEGYMDGMNTIFPTRKINKFDGKSSETQQINRANYYNPITGQSYGNTMPEGMVRVNSFSDLTPEAQDKYMKNHPTTLDELVVIPTPKKEINLDITNPESQAKLAEQERQNSHWYDYAVNNFKDTFGLNLRDVAGFVPVIGDALDINDIKNNINSGNYKDAAIGAGMFFLPNIIEKPLKKGLRYVKSNYRKLNRNFQYNPKSENIKLDYDDLNHATTNTIISKEFKEKNNQILNNPDNYGIPEEEIRQIVVDKMRELEMRNNNDIYRSINNEGPDVVLDYYRKSKDFKEFPTYVYYSILNKLDPSDPATVRSFIKNQGHSIRGVYTESFAEPYIDYLTIANNRYNPDRRGGDMFLSRGLYTSNATQVSDKFDKAIKNPNTRGYTAKLFRDFDIDESLPIKGQLQQLQDRILEYDVLKDVIPSNKMDALRKDNPEIYAWESPYFGTKVKQRAYVNSSSDYEKKVVDIVDLAQTGFGGVRKNRFGLNDKPTKDLFISQYPYPDKHNIDRYVKLGRQYTDRTVPNNKMYEAKNKAIEEMREKVKLNDDRRYNNKKIHRLQSSAGYKTRSKIKDLQKDLLTYSAITSGMAGIISVPAYLNNKDNTKKNKENKRNKK